MKKLITVPAIVLVFCVAVASTATAQTDIWQVGKQDGPVNPIDGASEFPANGVFTEEFIYVIGSDVDPVNSPTVNGYMANANICDYAVDGRPCTDTAMVQIFRFELDCRYEDVRLF